MACFMEIDKEEDYIALGDDVLKIVVVGARKCGKTTFITNVVNQNFPKGKFYINDIAVYSCEQEVNGKTRLIAFYEIPGNPAIPLEERTPHYEKADVIVYMYAIDDPSSVKYLNTKYIPETSEIIKSKPISIILLGNKIDLRNDPETINLLALNNEVPVRPDQIQGLFEPGLEKFFALEISSIKPNDCKLAFINICDFMFPFIVTDVD